MNQNHQTANIVIVACGLYEWFYTFTLLAQYWSKRNSSVYLISCLGAISHIVVICFYFKTIDDTLIDDSIQASYSAPAIFIASSVVQSSVLAVGLVQFRFLYTNSPKSALYVTIAVVIGFVSVLITGILAAVLAVTRMISLALLNIIVGAVFLYCSLMDTTLSIAFLNALIKEFGMDPVSARELIFSTDAKRLVVTGLLALLFGFTQMISAVLQITIPSNAKSIANATNWSNFIPALLYIYALNTFINLTYTTPKQLLAQNSSSAVELRGSNDTGINSRKKKQASTVTKSTNEHQDDGVTYTEEVQLQSINAVEGPESERQERIYHSNKEISHVAQIVNEAFTTTGAEKMWYEERWPLNSKDYRV